MSRGYLAYLPAILQQGDLLGPFLLAFEAVLSGLDADRLPPGLDPAAQGDLATPGLEQILARVDQFFDPLAMSDQEAKDFLPWLATWAATSLRDDWSLDTKRTFLSQVVPLYRLRGTRAGIEAVLKISGDNVRVVDFHDGQDEDLEAKAFRMPGETQRPYAYEKPPHLFGVILTVNQDDPTELARARRRVLAIVDQEKPAHTYYALRTYFPAMRINNDPAHNPAFGPGIRINDDPAHNPAFGRGIVLTSQIG